MIDAAALQRLAELHRAGNAWTHEERGAVLALVAEQRAEIAEAEKVCDSYARENQQFHDRIDRAEAALKVIAGGDGDAQIIASQTLAALAQPEETR
jgi:hypothetical protein